MLILVAVTISMAVNGGLFGYAGNAARETEIEKNKETRLANVPSNLTTEGLIDYYTKGEVEKATFSWLGYCGAENPMSIEFEVGMTWGEWVDSDYNQYGFTISPELQCVEFNHWIICTMWGDGSESVDAASDPGIRTDSIIYSGETGWNYFYFTD